MYTTQTNLSAKSKPDEEVTVTLTKSEWDKVTSSVTPTGMERERVLPIVDQIRIKCRLPPRMGVEYKLSVHA